MVCDLSRQHKVVVSADDVMRLIEEANDRRIPVYMCDEGIFVEVSTMPRLREACEKFVNRQFSKKCRKK